MILLDTDHLSVLSEVEGSGAKFLKGRMERSTDQVFATTIVSVEEGLRGWLAFINRYQDIHKQIPAYFRLGKLFDFLFDWEILLFDFRAAEEFTRLRRERVRIGTLDLKIGSIALVHNALLLSANLRDFRKVPGLRVENWLV